MGKLGKETKNLLLAITVICLISFLLAAGLSFLLAKDFQHEMLLHDYGVSGYQLNHEDKLQISAFTAHPNESDIERGKEALASIGYSEATSMQLLPTVREYRNQTMLYLFLLLTQIVITDDGKGIHQEDLYNIFKRFYRSRFSSDVHGIGLGLPLAKSIVEAHGGTISVTSTLNVGTTFTLNFFSLTNE